VHLIDLACLGAAGDCVTNVFLSYSRKDTAFVKALYAELSARGKDSWVDWKDIPPSAEWLQEIHAAIDSAEALVFVISPDSVRSEICRAELQFAVKRRKRLVPIVCREASGVPDEVAALNWLFFDGEDISAAVDRLIVTLDTDLDWIRLHTRLLVRAQQWIDQGRDHGSLLNGKDLREAERWLIATGAAEKARDVSPLHTEFIVASRQSASRRQRVLLIGVTAALVVTIALGLFAWHQRNGARARELAAVALDQIQTDPELGGLLARESAVAQDTPESENAIRRSALALRRQRWLIRGVHRAAIMFSADAGTVCAAAMGQVAVWSSRTGRPLVQRKVPIGVESVLIDHARAVATRVDEHIVRIWDPTSAKTLSVLRNDTGGIFSLWPSADGRRIATTTYEPLAIVWDTATGARLFDIRDHGHPIITVAFSPDGRAIATSSDGGPVELWDGPSGRFLCSVADDTQTEFQTFAADSQSFVTVDRHMTARSWSVAGCRAKATFSGHTSGIARAEFSSDGVWLVTASNDNTARIWRASSGELLTTLRGHKEAVNRARFSDRGDLVATVSDDRTCRIWDRASGTIVATLTGHTGAVRDVAFSPAGSEVITTGDDETVRMWDFRVPDDVVALSGHAGRVDGISFTADSTRVLTRSDDKTARVWDATTGRQVAAREFPDFIDDSKFSPDGKLVATASRGRPVLVWDTATGATVFELSGHRADVVAVSFSPDGQRVATGSSDATARVWSVRDAAMLYEVQGGGPVTAVEFSPDARYLLTVSYGSQRGDVAAVRIFDVGSGRAVAVLAAQLVTRIAHFSSDGRLLLIAGQDGIAQVFEAGSWRLRQRLARHSGAVTDADISRDNLRVLTAGLDKTVGLWDVRPGTLRATLRGHVNTVDRCQFSADGHVVATAGDFTARIWNATTGKPVLTLYEATDFVQDVSFSADGTMLAIAAADRTARIYPFELFALITDVRAVLERRLSRTLTDQERRQFLHELQPVARVQEWFDEHFSMNIGS